MSVPTYPIHTYLYIDFEGFTYARPVLLGICLFILTPSRVAASIIIHGDEKSGVTDTHHSCMRLWVCCGTWSKILSVQYLVKIKIKTPRYTEKSGLSAL